MRFHLGLGSKVRKILVASPVKEKPLNGENPDAGLDFKSNPAAVFGFGFRSPEFGSKDDIFFDSKVCLDSDCEDDFYSVDGEFTPSRGSTPNYQILKAGSPRLDKAFFADSFLDSKSETSPTSRKKLSDLLQETLQGEQVGNMQNAAEVKVDSDGTPYLSGAISISSNEATPRRDSKNRKDRTRKATNCCMPSLVPSFSFNERRQKLSPVSCSAE